MGIVNWCCAGVVWTQEVHSRKSICVCVGGGGYSDQRGYIDITTGTRELKLINILY
jgi:hypothetical protein